MKISTMGFLPLFAVCFLGIATVTHGHHGSSESRSSSGHTSWDQQAIFEYLTRVELQLSEIADCKQRLEDLEDEVCSLKHAIAEGAIVPGLEEGSVFYITLNMFSGIRDISWRLSPSDERYRIVFRYIAAYASREQPRILGYRGFTLTQPECESCTPRMVAKHTNRALELLLLITAPRLDQNISDIVTDTINNPPPPADPILDIYTAFPPYPYPVYEPWLWNDYSDVRLNNNCYNYANDIRTDTFAQPGRATGNQYQALTGYEVYVGAISDDLEFVAVESYDGIPIPDNGNLVVLVMNPGYDFHWYRRDNSGYWSHKPGGTAATNLDNSGNPITDPRLAERGPYTEFTAFMSTQKLFVTII